MLRNLRALSSNSLVKFFTSFNNIFCDFDGVMCDHLTREPIHNVKESLQLLKKFNKNIYVLTNNTTIDKKSLRDYEIIFNDIITPTDVMIDYLKKINFKKEIYVIGSSNMKNQISRSGLKLTEDEPTVIEESFIEYLKHLEDNLKVGCVIIDWDFNVTHLKLLKASIYLKRDDVLYLTGGLTDKIRVYDKTCFGVSFFQEALSNFCKRQPISFGKPSTNLKNYIYDKYKINSPRSTLMIGDHCENDMGFASICGFQKLLVLTGLTNVDHMKNLESKYQPDYYLNSFGNIRELLDQLPIK